MNCFSNRESRIPNILISADLDLKMVQNNRHVGLITVGAAYYDHG